MEGMATNSSTHSPGTRNAVIRAWWTPYSLRIEQRANKNDLESAHTPISDRSSTFDGHMHNSEIRNMHGEDLRDEVTLSGSALSLCIK